MMLDWLKPLLVSTVRRQLIVGIGLIVALTMSLFIWDQTRRQQNLVLEQQAEQALALARTVAISSAAWVASRDFSGLQEVIQSVSHHPDLRHALVLDGRGQVLAHTDPARIGQYLTDRLRETEPMLQHSGGIVDASAPVMLGARQIGSVRIGVARDAIDNKLSQMTRGGILYAFLVVVLSVGVAALAARYLTRRLYAIQQVADAVQTGHSEQRASVSGSDEAATLARQFNRMLDAQAERRKAQKLAQAQLQAALAFSNNLIGSMLDGFSVLDADGCAVDANPAFCRMTGFSREELIGVGAPFPYWPPEEYENIEVAFRKTLAGVPSQYELTFMRKSGERFPVIVSPSTINDVDGNILSYIATVKDISERRRAEVAHKSLESQLRESQKMEAIGTLAGGIAHDFNNALATILGNVELAREDAGANRPLLESLKEIRKAGSRARDLVQQILAFSRRQPTARKLLSLATAVEESARLLRMTLPARLKLDVHCSADVPTVLADATQMQQVLLNLATNAMQAMPAGAGCIHIRLDTVLLDAAMAHAHPVLRTLHVKNPGRTVRLVVSDDGPGMDAATVQRVFEPFFTTKPVNEGTGLGLSVVHGIVQAHDGAIEVESQLGNGAIFRIYLPPADGLSDAPTPVLNKVVAPVAIHTETAQRILYLDDDESLVFLVQRLLERRGYRVSGYVDQRQALDALSADPSAFDLFVTDYNMPGMSGLDVARAVRTLRADLPVAIASGFIDETLERQASGAGVRELIFKANAVEELCETFARMAQSIASPAKLSAR